MLFRAVLLAISFALAGADVERLCLCTRPPCGGCSQESALAVSTNGGALLWLGGNGFAGLGRDSAFVGSSSADVVRYYSNKNLVVAQAPRPQVEQWEVPLPVTVFANGYTAYQSETLIVYSRSATPWVTSVSTRAAVTGGTQLTLCGNFTADLSAPAPELVEAWVGGVRCPVNTTSAAILQRDNVPRCYPGGPPGVNVTCVVSPRTPPGAHRVTLRLPLGYAAWGTSDSIVAEGTAAAAPPPPSPPAPVLSFSIQLLTPSAAPGATLRLTTQPRLFAGAQVWVDRSPCLNATYTGNNISCTVPPGGGLVNVSVLSRGGEARAQFAYDPPHSSSITGWATFSSPPPQDTRLWAAPGAVAAGAEVAALASARDAGPWDSPQALPGGSWTVLAVSPTAGLLRGSVSYQSNAPPENQPQPPPAPPRAYSGSASIASAYPAWVTEAGQPVVIRLTSADAHNVQSVTIEGVPCAITAAQGRDIVCVPGPMPAALPQGTSPRSCVSLPEGCIPLPVGYAQRWSAAGTWVGSPPTDGDTVVVPRGKRVLLDSNVTLTLLLSIEGGLVVDGGPGGVLLTAAYVVVRSGGGLLANMTRGGAFTLTLVGGLELPVFFGQKVLAVSGGSLELHGSPISSPWTQLAEDAPRGERTLTLAANVSDWPVGGLVAVAPTGMGAGGTEVFSIVSVSGNRLTLNASLSAARSGRVGRGGIDRRAEVALLTRSVVVQGDMESYDTETGAHVMMAREGAAPVTAHLSNVLLRRVGQAAQLGRYALHPHMMGDVSGGLRASPAALFPGASTAPSQCTACPARSCRATWLSTSTGTHSS